jgi:hypothetical protein
MGEARCPTAARHVAKDPALAETVKMIDLASIIMLAGAFSAAALVAAAHPKIERLVRRAYLR